MKTLHILNGDGTASSFRDSGLPGDILIWREMLMEGPVHEWQDEEAFLRSRARFLNTVAGDQETDYEKVFLPEYSKLLTVSGYDEVVLWFEFDLFCQVNLWYLLAWFYSHQPAIPLSLVSPGSHPEVRPFYGMGQLSPGQLAALYPGRQRLDRGTRELGAMVWSEFANQQQPTFEMLERFHIPDHGLEHLEKALKSHWKRFPSRTDGLNAIERSIVGALKDGPRTPGELFRTFMEKQPGYGLGDLQFFAELKGMMPDWVEKAEDGFRLTEAGQELAAGRRNRLEMAFPEKWLGGYRLEKEAELWWWDEEAGTLVATGKTGSDF